MTPIKTRCPSCRALLSIALPDHGQAVAAACPKCGHKFVPTEVPDGSRAGMLVVGGAVVLVLGILSVCVVGIGLWMFRDNDQKPLGPLVKIDDPKDDPKPDPFKPPVKPKPKPDPDPDPFPNPKPKLVKPKIDSLIPFTAMGPEQSLLKIQAMRFKGQLRTFKPLMSVNLVIASEGLRRMKSNEEGTGSFAFFYRDHGWDQQNSSPRALTGGELNHQLQLTYAITIGSVIPLLDDGFELAKLGERTIKDRPCYGISVKRERRPAVNLFFDSQTHLLMKSDFLLAPPGGGKSVFVEFFYSDYVDTDGILHWRKRQQWREDRQFDDFTITEINFFEAPHEILFKVDGIAAQMPAIMAEYQARDRQDDIQRALRQIGPGKGSDFTRLALALNVEATRDKAQRGLLAYAELVKNGQAARLDRSDVDALVVILKFKENPKLQAMGIESAIAMGQDGQAAAPALLDLLKDLKDARTIAATISALRSVGATSDAFVKLVVAYCDHADAGVRDAASLALLHLAPDRITIKQAIELTGQPNADIRSAAHKVLKQQLAKVTPKDMTTLRDGLKESNREVCLAFVDAVASLKVEAVEAAPELAALLASADPDIARQAAAALDQMGKLVSAAQATSDATVLRGVLAALRSRKNRSPEAQAAYEKHLEHPSAEVRNEAVLALIDFGPDRLKIDRLTDLLGKTQGPARIAASKLLRQKLKEVTAKDIPVLRAGLQNPSREIQLAYMSGIEALGKDGKELAADLVPLVGVDKDIAIAACAALGSVGKSNDEAIRTLVKALEGAEKPVKVAAAGALARIAPEHDLMKSKGINLLLDSLKPNTTELDTFLADPLKDMPVEPILSLGPHAVEPIMRRMLVGNDPKLKANQDDTTTATRLLAYELIKTLASRAKISGDKELTKALRDRADNLKFTWKDRESDLARAKQSNKNARLYSRTAKCALDAHSAVYNLAGK